MQTRGLPRMPAIVWGLLLAMVLSACNHSKPHAVAAPPPKPDRLWSQYIASHTAGTVSRHAQIVVHFSRDVAAPELVGKSAAQVLTIEPGVPGVPRFTSTRDIVLQPEQPLLPGQAYRGHIDAAHLSGLPDQLAPYEFDFQALRPDFEVKVSGLETAAGDDSTLVLHGTLDTADGEEPKLVEQMLSAQYQGQPQKLEWAHFNDNRSHYFSIRGLQKQEQKASVHLAWTGKPLALDNEGSREVDIPARNTFEVLDAKIAVDGRQSVRIAFSAALDVNQNLRGLVQLGKSKLNASVEGSTLVVYPADSVVGEQALKVEPAVRSARGGHLAAAYEAKLTFVNEKPQVRFAGQGVVLPDNEKLSIPFEGMNVKAVQVTAFQIFDSDIGQFLQANKLEGDAELPRVGRYLWRHTIQLPDPKADVWTRYALDATDLLREHPGSLFRLTLSINRGDSSYNCSSEDLAVAPVPEEPYQNNEDLNLSESSGWDGISEYYEDAGSGEGDGDQPAWKDRGNPCKDAYFRWDDSTRAARYFMSSNIGLLAKRGAGGALHVVATRLSDATPLPGAKIELRNFQNLVVGSGTTDAQGFAEIDPSGTPFYMIAHAGEQVGYLKLNRATALPTSHFDTGGETVNGGIKGFIYGERGVWRPGDDIFLTFILEDKANRIPAGHPVTMQLFSPKGQLAQTVTNAKPVDNFYSFVLHTAPDAPTGGWMAKALVGGAEFSQALKIETVMPNRLKMELKFPDSALHKADMPAKGSLFAQWLQGATAAGLKADVSVKLSPVPTTFTRFGDYVFDDPARSFSGERTTIFEDKLDSSGNVQFDAQIDPASDAPGMLQANFTTRVFEDSGAFSIGESTLPYHPYEHYVGVKAPKGDQARGIVLTDQDHAVEIASVDSEGKPVSLPKVKVSLYKIEWKWWWDQTKEDLTQFSQATVNSAIKEDTIATTDGHGTWTFQVKYPEWGRYLIRACDIDGGHCSGKVIYIDWPGWAGRAQETAGPAASALSFFTDKPKYTVGDTAVVQLPDATQGRALLTIETGSRIIDQKWVEFTVGKTKLDIPVTPDMSPNAYISIALIQPHQGKQNDRPIRLYGIVPIEADDPSTRLAPQIKADDVWRPNGKVKVQVSEKSGRAMTYTLAVVDEGLLGLTSYQTPDPHTQFYKREALGVLTWDLFDDVAGAYGGALERLLALGGDTGAMGRDRQKQNRFPPVVRVIGPFQLAAGATDAQEIDLPQYAGAVRVMVVAGHAGAYGAADKSVIVREPVTILPTLPRVLGPGETARVPVSVFTFEPEAKDVAVTIEAAKGVSVDGATSAQLKFAQPSEQLASFALKADAGAGVSKVTLRAQSGPFHTEASVNLPIRAQNPAIVQAQRHDLAPGEEWQLPVQPAGVAGTNSVTLEIAGVPPFDLERRLDYLIEYPYGCVEQTTSAVFPQLYLNDLVLLDDARHKRIDNDVQAGIERLRSFQLADGGFSYWPGTGQLDDWASNYAGHFLVEARRLGYQVPDEMYDAWVNHQKLAAAAWTAGGPDMVANQAYRLLSLALADHPDIGAMNRLREMPQLAAMPAWQLAQAYSVIGLADAGRELLNKAGTSTASYVNVGETYGSELRDRAILLETEVALGNRGESDRMAEALAKDLSSDSWYSTQTTAYSLMAMARYVSGNPAYAAPAGAEKSYGFTYALNGGAAQAMTSEKPLVSVKLPQLADSAGQLSVHNTSQRILHATLVQRGSPPPGQEHAASNGLGIAITYTTTKGEPVDVTTLKQGTDFLAHVAVTNNSGQLLKDLALTEVMPSGWEIHNPRFEEGGAPPPQADYQDVRDDRVMTFFGLKASESRSYQVLLNATYVGHYYLPAAAVESMYNARYNAHSAGQWVDVAPDSGKGP